MFLFPHEVLSLFLLSEFLSSLRRLSSGMLSVRYGISAFVLALLASSAISVKSAKKSLTRAQLAGAYLSSYRISHSITRKYFYALRKKFDISSNALRGRPNVGRTVGTSDAVLSRARNAGSIKRSAFFEWRKERAGKRSLMRAHFKVVQPRWYSHV